METATISTHPTKLTVAVPATSSAKPTHPALTPTKEGKGRFSTNEDTDSDMSISLHRATGLFHLSPPQPSQRLLHGNTTPKEAAETRLPQKVTGIFLGNGI